MAACRNHTTTSSYRAIVGLTKQSPVIQTQTLSLDNTEYHGSGKYSLTVNNNTSHVTSLCIITSEASISLFRIAITNGIPVVMHPCMPSEIDPPDVYVYFAHYSVQKLKTSKI